jgi:hypothetical protein
VAQRPARAVGSGTACATGSSRYSPSTSIHSGSTFSCDRKTSVDSLIGAHCHNRLFRRYFTEYIRGTTWFTYGRCVCRDARCLSASVEEPLKCKPSPCITIDWLRRRRSKLIHHSRPSGLKYQEENLGSSRGGSARKPSLSNYGRGLWM